MTRVLLITADPVLSKTITLMLGHARGRVLSTAPDREALDMARHGNYDAVLVDMDSEMPDEFVDALHRAAAPSPLLMLTDDAEVDASLGNVLAKPFHREDLMSRLDALRRGADSVETRIEIGSIDIDREAGEARVGGKRVPLTGKEFEVLDLLATRRGTTLTKDMFLNHLYGGINEPEMKIIDVFVCKLRKKLAKATGGQHYIETVWGRGYVMRGPEMAPEMVADGGPGERRRAAPG